VSNPLVVLGDYVDFETRTIAYELPEVEVIRPEPFIDMWGDSGVLTGHFHTLDATRSSKNSLLQMYGAAISMEQLRKLYPNHEERLAHDDNT